VAFRIQEANLYVISFAGADLMLKQEEQTQGQKLLKQLRDTYRKTETPADESFEHALCDDDSESWPVPISDSIN